MLVTRGKQVKRTSQKQWLAPFRAHGLALWLSLALSLTLVAAAPGTVLAQASATAAASLDAAVSQVERSHGGRILSARSEQRGGDLIYVIRVLTDDQQVRNVEVPAAPGAKP